MNFRIRVGFQGPKLKYLKTQDNNPLTAGKQPQLTCYVTKLVQRAILLLATVEVVPAWLARNRPTGGAVFSP
jgi:hypothetical protein